MRHITLNIIDKFSEVRNLKELEQLIATDQQVFWKGFITPLILLYLIFGRPYSRFLRNRYGYHLLGIPTLVAIVGASLPGLLGWIGVERFAPYVGFSLEYSLRAMAFAIPGLVLATIWCFAKSGNPFVCIINIPIICLITVVASAFVIVAAIVAVACLVLPAFASEGAATLRPSAAHTCSYCGTWVAEGERCGCRGNG